MLKDHLEEHLNFSDETWKYNCIFISWYWNGVHVVEFFLPREQGLFIINSVVYTYVTDLHNDTLRLDNDIQNRYSMLIDSM